MNIIQISFHVLASMNACSIPKVGRQSSMHGCDVRRLISLRDARALFSFVTCTPNTLFFITRACYFRPPGAAATFPVGRQISCTPNIPTCLQTSPCLQGPHTGCTVPPMYTVRNWLYGPHVWCSSRAGLQILITGLMAGSRTQHKSVP